MAGTIIFMMNAAAGKHGIDGGSVFGVEAVRFCREKGCKVIAVGPARPLDRLKESIKGCLDGVEIVPTPVYDIDHEGAGAFEVVSGFVRRAFATKPILESRIRKLLDSGEADSVSIFFQDHLPETLPAFHVKKVFGDKVELFFGRHLMVYSLFSSFRDIHAKSFSLPGPRMIYHYLTQTMATMKARRCEVTFSVPGAVDRDFLVGKGFARDKVIVTPYAPEKQLVQSVKSGPKTERMAYLGRYHPQKGLEDLIDIARYFKELTGRDFELDLMGNLNPLKEKIPADMKASFAFLGSVYSEDKYRRLKESKVFVFPSYHESFGLVILEAMACGVPVVAYDLEVYREIFTKGIVKVPVGDKRGFAEALKRLYTDEAHYAKMSSEALELAAQYDWTRTFEKLFAGAGFCRSTGA